VSTYRWSRVPAAHRVMLVCALAVAVLAFGYSVAQSQSGSTPPYPAAEKHKPSTLADRVVLTYEGDPATTQSVTWRTDPTVVSPQAQLALAQEGPGFEGSATTVRATKTTTQNATIGYPNVFHTARFTGLEPSTNYLYRLGDGTNGSECVERENASDKADPFSFVYYGDAQNDLQEHWSRVVRRAFADAPEARLWLHAGDLVDTSTSDPQWGEWFSAGGWINGQLPSFATPGNHEYSGSALTPYWRTQFEFPDNGPSGTGPVYDALKETVFHTDYQGVRFISLNSNVGAVSSSLRQQFVNVQAAWLEGVLQNNPSRWTVVTFHHPIFANEPSRSNPMQRAAWLPILERYGVDLVLQGHDHSYGRGNLAEGTTAVTPTGTVYVVSVSGPKMYEADDSDWVANGAVATHILTNTQLYQVVSVSGNRLKYQAKTAGGRLHDAFTIAKAADGEKTLTEWDGSALGNPGLGSKVDDFDGRKAQAFRTRSQGSGTLDRLNVYLDEETTARRLLVGIYTDRNGHPGELIASGEDADGLSKGTWNPIALPGEPRVAKGEKYWIALLGLGGSLAVRDECCGAAGSEPAEMHKKTGISALPGTWITGQVWPTDGPVSAFAPITGG